MISYLYYKPKIIFLQYQIFFIISVIIFDKSYIICYYLSINIYNKQGGFNEKFIGYSA